MRPNEAPVLELIPYGPEHVDRIQTLASKPDNVRLTNVPHPYPPDGASQFLQFSLEGEREGNSLDRVVKRNGEVIGMAGLLHRQNPSNRQVGYWLDEAFWNRGFGRQVVSQLVRLCSEEFGWNEIHADVLPENGASRRILALNGFRVTGRIPLPPDHHKFPNQDMLRMTRNRSTSLFLGHIAEPDIEALALLLEELSGEATDLPTMRRNFRSLEVREDVHLLGAWIDGTLVGCLMGIVCTDLVGDGRPFMVLENVVVSSSHRGHGIGRALIERIEDVCRQARCAYVLFVSSAHRTDAHRFYEALGYRTDSVQGFKKFFAPSATP